MADPADTAAATHDATGHDSAAGVDIPGNDAFGDAFAAFAAGTPAPDIEDEDDEGDAAGEPGADEGRDPPPADGAEGSPPSDAPGRPAAGDEPDPWANATPAQKAALQKMRDDYERKVQGASGRASGLQRQLNALTGGTAVPPATARQAPAKEADKPDAWKAMDAKIKALREDYPEIADVLVPLLEAQRDELIDLRGRVAPVTAAEEEREVAAQQADLESKHPDWRGYAPGQNAAFDGWLNAQPQSVQKLAGSWDSREVGVALTLFKTEQAEAMRNAGGAPPKNDTATGARRQRQLDGGRVVGSRPGSATTGAPDDFEAAFEHYSKKA